MTFNIYYFARILKRIEQGKVTFDLIHTNSSATRLGAYLSKKLKVPHVWHIREYGKKDYGLNYSLGLKRTIEYIHNNSDVVLLISNNLRDYYSNMLTEDKKLRVIYNGIKIPNKTDKKNEQSNINLSVIGVISEAKNQLEVLKAAKYLKENHNIINYRFNFVGEGDDAYINTLKDFVKKNHLEENVAFLGYMPNIQKHLSKMDIGIVTSKNEAFGRVTVEFMMNNIPVIASDSGANGEIIQNGTTGLLYKLGDYEALANAIKHLVDDKEVRQLMGSRASARAIKNFSSKDNAKKIYELYKSLFDR